jgi:hypothetical protein
MLQIHANAANAPKSPKSPDFSSFCGSVLGATLPQNGEKNSNYHNFYSKHFNVSMYHNGVTKRYKRDEALNAINLACRLDTTKPMMQAP